MLLAVDVGNTQTALGLFDKGKTLVSSGRIPTVATHNTEELLTAVCTMFACENADERMLKRAVIACVVPVLTEPWIECCHRIGIDDITVVDASTVHDLDIALDDPSEAGADRLANAIGAKARYHTPVIVVDFGTATTIDVIDRAGAYRGGIISPGLETSADALYRHAARLSQIELTVLPQVIGTSTTTAVQSGLVYGEVSKVDGLVTRIIEELAKTDGDAEPTVVATGGLAEMLAPFSTTVEQVDRDLTLYGLCEIASSGSCAVRHQKH